MSSLCCNDHLLPLGSRILLPPFNFCQLKFGPRCFHNAYRPVNNEADDQANENTVRDSLGIIRLQQAFPSGKAGRRSRQEMVWRNLTG
ncbi:uncharacterized protein EAE97_009097 [Botrytis byssoidea]|uniref:Uncharacterized protein n=1 Tax=Botrytis byssoidea TaxID=139641 RepID=A0A9P5M0L1_9HELO|nr:uncharacterized protein EAE97_009097 [Botrytis byssoidea]KAF7932076.1 hypothetical protein EAE97_009097 [Botrytis byssoidea]